MRTVVGRLYHGTDIGHRLLGPWVRFRDWLWRGGILPDRVRIARDFRRVFGRRMPWRAPETLNEKLNWMKANVRDPLQRMAADKYAVRAWVAEQIGEEHLIPLLGCWRRACDFRLGDLPEAFVVKVNHGSGQNRVIRDKGEENEAALRRQLDDWLHTSHYALSCEPPYRGILPMILAEKLLQTGGGRLPFDYKFHCFGGKVEVVQVDQDRECDHRRNFYDVAWRSLPFVWCEWDGGRPLWPGGAAVPRPAALGEMVELAEKLARPWPYVRVDLYIFEGRIYFGELTFYHGSGLERFDPEEWDRRLGEKLVLPGLIGGAGRGGRPAVVGSRNEAYRRRGTGR